MNFSQHILPLSDALQKKSIYLSVQEDVLRLEHAQGILRCQILVTGQEPTGKADFVYPLDVLIRQPQHFLARIQSLLHLNKVLYARQCRVEKITKQSAADFLNTHHIMGATSSARQYGLFEGDTLVCVATYSAGRKMNRLPIHERSFELIRFCTLAGTTVTGGLSRLLRQFIRDHQPGDIMTFIDQQLFTGTAYLKAGFEIVGSSTPHRFVINRHDFSRSRLTENHFELSDDAYVYTDQGNLKLILKPESVSRKIKEDE